MADTFGFIKALHRNFATVVTVRARQAMKIVE
jgi:hypothetical protein